MCYLQGSSIGVTMIKTSYFLYSLPMLRQMLSTALSPKKSNFWVLYFGHCLSRTHGGPASSFLNCIWIWVEVIAIIVICKQKLACLQGFANCVLGGLCISPKQSQPRNLWNGHGVPCHTLPSAKFHCFRALDVLSIPLACPTPMHRMYCKRVGWDDWNPNKSSDESVCCQVFDATDWLHTFGHEQWRSGMSNELKPEAYRVRHVQGGVLGHWKSCILSPV